MGVETCTPLSPGPKCSGIMAVTQETDSWPDSLTQQPEEKRRKEVASRVRLLCDPMIVSYYAPLSMDFSGNS